MLKINKVALTELTAGKKYMVKINDTDVAINILTGNTKIVPALVGTYNLKLELIIVEEIIVLNILRGDKTIMNCAGASIKEFNEVGISQCAKSMPFYLLPAITYKSSEIWYSVKNTKEKLSRNTSVEVTDGVFLSHNGTEMELRTKDDYVLFNGHVNHYISLFGTKTNKLASPVGKVDIVENEVKLIDNHLYIRPLVQLTLDGEMVDCYIDLSKINPGIPIACGNVFMSTHKQSSVATVQTQSSETQSVNVNFTYKNINISIDVPNIKLNSWMIDEHVSKLVAGIRAVMPINIY